MTGRYCILAAFLVCLFPPRALAEEAPTGPVLERTGKMLAGGSVVFSFRRKEVTSGDLVIRTSLLCFPRRANYLATIRSDSKAGLADFSFCQVVRREAQGECLKILRLPSGRQPVGAEGVLSAVTYGSRSLEVAAQDVLTVSVQAWLAEEWEAVDPQMRNSLTLSLIASARTQNGLGPEASLAVLFLPQTEMSGLPAEEFRVTTLPENECVAGE
jgi:hypothetical protein